MLYCNAVYLLHKVLKGQDIAVEIAGKHNDTVYDLGDQRNDQDHDKQDDGEDREQDRQRMPELFLIQFIKYIGRVYIDERPQNIGDHKSHKDRRSHSPDSSEKLQYSPYVCQQQVESYCRAQGKGIDKPFFFQEIFVEFHVNRILLENDISRLACESCFFCARIPRQKSRVLRAVE